MKVYSTGRSGSGAVGELKRASAPGEDGGHRFALKDWVAAAKADPGGSRKARRAPPMARHRSEEGAKAAEAACRGCAHWRPDWTCAHPRCPGCAARNPGGLVERILLAATACPDSPPKWRAEPAGNLILTARRAG